MGLQQRGLNQYQDLVQPSPMLLLWVFFSPVLKSKKLNGKNVVCNQLTPRSLQGTGTIVDMVPTMYSDYTIFLEDIRWTSNTLNQLSRSYDDYSSSFPCIYFESNVQYYFSKITPNLIRKNLLLEIEDAVSLLTQVLSRF